MIKTGNQINFTDNLEIYPHHNGGSVHGLTASAPVQGMTRPSKTQ